MDKELLPFVFLPLFAFTWLAAMGITARLGGWTRLAEKYRVTGDMPEGRKIERWHSATFRGMLPASYRNCLNVLVAPQGIGLFPMRIFSFAHPPLFIPWADMALTEGKNWMGKFIEFDVRDSNVKIRFHAPKVMGPVLAAYKP